MAPSATSAGSSQLNETLSQMQQRIRIDKAEGVNVIVRSIGNEVVAIYDISVYIDEALVACQWSASSVQPGSIISCRLKESCSKKTLRVTAPDGADKVICS